MSNVKASSRPACQVEPFKLLKHTDKTQHTQTQYRKGSNLGEVTVLHWFNIHVIIPNAPFSTSHKNLNIKYFRRLHLHLTFFIKFMVNKARRRADCKSSPLTVSTSLHHISLSHLPLCPSALLSPPAKCLYPSPGERTPLPSHRSSFSSLWLRSDDDRLWLDGVEVDRCSVLLYT